MHAPLSPLERRPPRPVRRHVFDATTGAGKDFVSGYSAAAVPNLWAAAA